MHEIKTELISTHNIRLKCDQLLADVYKLNKFKEEPGTYLYNLIEVYKGIFNNKSVADFCSDLNTKLGTKQTLLIFQDVVNCLYNGNVLDFERYVYLPDVDKDYIKKIHTEFNTIPLVRLEIKIPKPINTLTPLYVSSVSNDLTRLIEVLGIKGVVYMFKILSTKVYYKG